MGKNVKRKLTEVFELPKESVLNIPYLTMIGREEIVIENYKGIIEYNENIVRINTGIGVLVIEGRNLLLKNILIECIVITGTIISVCFTC